MTTDLGHILDVGSGLVQVDERTEADITHAAVCEITWARCVRIGNSLPRMVGPLQTCEEPAAWIEQTTCKCGHQETRLICDPHHHGKDGIVSFCRACHAEDSHIVKDAKRI